MRERFCYGSADEPFELDPTPYQTDCSKHHNDGRNLDAVDTPGNRSCLSSKVLYSS